MKAAVLIDAHNMIIEDVPKPVPGAGEVLLKVDSCGICGTDMEFYETGSYNSRWTLGHECSGVIAEIGPGVKGWKLGERVTVNDMSHAASADSVAAGWGTCATAPPTSGYIGRAHSPSSQRFRRARFSDCRRMSQWQKARSSPRSQWAITCSGRRRPNQNRKHS